MKTRILKQASEIGAKTTGLKTRVLSQNPYRQPAKQEEQESKSFDLGKALSNIPSSGVQMVKDIGSALFHPVETVKGLGTLVKGGFEKLTPGVQESEASFDALINFYKDRYGSIDNLKRTVEEDPVGFAADLADVLTLGGSAVSKVGKVSKVAKIADIGSDIAKLGKFIDPVSIPSKVFGSLAKKFSGKSFAPLASKIDTDVKALADKYKIELNPSQMNKSDWTKLADKAGISEAGKTRIAKLADKIEELSQNVKEKSIGAASPEMIGRSILDKAEGIKGEFTMVKNSFYSDAVKKLKNPWVEIKKFTKEFDAILKGKESAKIPPKDLGVFKKAKTLLLQSDGKTYRNSIRLKEAVETLRSINERSKFGKATQLDALGEVLNGIIKKTVEGTEYGKSIKIADSLFGGTKELMKSDMFKHIIKNSNDPAKIYKMIGKQAPDVARDVMNFVGDNTKEGIRKLIFTDMVGELSTATGNFKQNAISRVIDGWGENTLSAIFDKSQIAKFRSLGDNLEDINKLKEVLKSGKAVAKTAENVKTVRLFAKVSTALSFDIKKIIGAFLGDYAVDKLVNTDWVQSLIRGESVELPTVPQKGLDALINLERTTKEPGRILEASKED